MAFHLEALVDFPDDAMAARQPLTRDAIDAMMARLAASGVRRVSWATYGDGHGGYFMPGGLDPGWVNYVATLKALENPLRVAVECGHRHGLEVYGYFKPYETGPALVFPDASPEARNYGRLWQLGGYLSWLDPFVVNNPSLRLRRKPGGASQEACNRPVCAIRLIKKDDAPTRITKVHLEIWTSDKNYRYRPLPVDLHVHETVEVSPGEIRGLDGSVVTGKGERVRVLTLTGFSLDDQYILVTTNFKEGPGDFENLGTELFVALDQSGEEIPGVFSSGAAVWEGDRVDFRDWGVIFDVGWTCQNVVLDAQNTAPPEVIGYGSGRKGFVAFTRGRNEYLPGALCETEPMVQAYWLSWINEMIASGVDGVDLRVENHSTHTDYPEEYGYNQVVLERAAVQNPDDPFAAVPAVRGEAYTEFLRKAKAMLALADKRMRINLNVDFFRPDPPPVRLPAYPLNIHFDWNTWITEGLLDEAILRFFEIPFDAVFDDAVAKAMMTACDHKRIPVVFNRYINDAYEAEFNRVRADGRFTGFILYETANCLSFDADGTWRITSEPVERVIRAHHNQ